jgi:hypothetical protein
VIIHDLAIACKGVGSKSILNVGEQRVDVQAQSLKKLICGLREISKRNLLVFFYDR